MSVLKKSEKKLRDEEKQTNTITSIELSVLFLIPSYIAYNQLFYFNVTQTEWFNLINTTRTFLTHFYRTYLSPVSNKIQEIIYHQYIYIKDFLLACVYPPHSNTYTNKNFVSITFQRQRQKVKHLTTQVSACGF
jgi:hypothetical protein